MIPQFWRRKRQSESSTCYNSNYVHSWCDIRQEWYPVLEYRKLAFRLIIQRYSLVAYSTPSILCVLPNPTVNWGRFILSLICLWLACILPILLLFHLCKKKEGQGHAREECENTKTENATVRIRALSMFGAWRSGAGLVPHAPLYYSTVRNAALTTVLLFSHTL